MTKVENSQSIENLLAKLGYPGESLLSLTEKWENFIEDCESGYTWDFSEYRHEIISR